MSEDARSTKVRKVLYVANPGSGDSDDASEDNRRARTNGHVYPYRRPPPQASSLSHQHRPTPSQPTILTTDLTVNNSHYQPPPQPSLSPDSTGSPAAEESTPPPTTPSLHAHSASVDLPPKAESPSKPSSTPDSNNYNDRTPSEPTPQSTTFSTTSRKGRFFQPFKAPFGSRPLRTSVDNNAPRRPRTSPTVATPDSYTSPSSVASTSAVPEKVIFATADSERYVTVDISGAKTAAQIRELILSKLNIYNDDEHAPFAIYQTEIGSFAIGEALTPDRLLALCRDQGDSKGSLKFFISHASAPVHEPPTPQSMEYTMPPPVLPHHMVSINPLRVKRRSRSRNGSFSSTSENLPLEVAAGYEADLDYPDRDTNKLTTRPSQHSSALQVAAATAIPPSPRRRPSIPHHRPSSPLIQAPDPATSLPSSDRSWSQRKEEKYLPALPLPPPLSPNRPTFSLHDEPSSLSVPQNRLLHVRTGSDAGAERELALRASEQITGDVVVKPLRRPEHVSIGKLRPEPSRDNMRELRPSRRTYEEDEGSWEMVPTVISMSGDSQERPSSQISRSVQRQQGSSRYRPTSPYTNRHIINNPPTRPPPPAPSVLQESRPSTRPARVPLTQNIFVTWKGEEGGNRKASSAAPPTWSRLGKNVTKSMDNLKLSSQSSRRGPPPQLPMTRPTTNMRDTAYSPSTLTHSGIPKSYEPPRPNFVRPLPVQGSSYATSPDFAQGSSTQYSARGSGYSSNLISPSLDPFPRPQSAAGDSVTSPTRGYSRLQSPIYGPTLDSGESNRSPRAVSPHRAYHSPGIPGPRPRPTNYSDRSDRSSDIQSGPETSNTTPPRTPVSPQSPRYTSQDKNGFVIEPSSPSSPANSISISTNRSSDMTLKQEDQMQFAKMLDRMGDGTYVPPRSSQQQPERLTRQLTPPQSHSSSTSRDSYIPDSDDDDEDSDNGGGTWIVPPERPPLKVQIDSSIGSHRTETGSSQNSQDTLTARSNQTAPPRPPPKTNRSAEGRPESTFIDADSDSWAPRPPPENIYERLDQFFSKHDLDKPVIEAVSGDTSPTTAEPTIVLPPPIPIAATTSSSSDKARIRAKKSIRIVAQEHKKRIDRTSRADPAAFATNALRKRNTKLWGSKLEEVTTAPPRSGSNISLPESPSGGPTTFKWVRGELIGKGTYGRVYLALNATTGEMIAVKQVELPQTASDKNDSRQHTVVQALKMESETLKDLDHPNIVQYLGFEETPANLSIFLEYVPGGSVGSCLHKHGKFDDIVTRSFTAQILSGLEYLHSKGILHRDLKADNILVEMSGTCKISDFGISKRTEDVHGGAFTAMQGTVFWMAPEVINTQKKGYNFKIDIWSVGCVVLEMWAGMRPWMGEEMVAVMFKLYSSKLPPPVPEDVVLSEEADDFRLKCFAINPEERPSAAELRKHPYLLLPPGWVFTGFT
ncbi:hypothetical protein B0H34DRAFT_792833 [Crassisporium funariophilum]|nr:hypothetical protein B0H34DRAFT_792833 [Crassisporium funariophilum]